MEEFITNSLTKKLSEGTEWTKACVEIGSYQQFSQFKFDSKGNAEFKVYASGRVLKVRRNRTEFVTTYL